MTGCKGDKNNDSNNRTEIDTVLLDYYGNPIKPYKELDTVYYGPAKSNTKIPLSQLPIKNLSFKQILKEFGTDSLIIKTKGGAMIEGDDKVRSLTSHSIDSIPEMLYNNCKRYIKSNYSYYEYVFSYHDGSNDYLQLFVIRDSSDIKILWGYRVPSDYLWPE